MASRKFWRLENLVQEKIWQAVKEVLPEAVQLITPDHTDSYYGVDYIQFLTAFGINGLKELHALVKSLTERVNILENKINKKVQDISVDK